MKALLWPIIRHEGDLEHVAEQGFWMCLLVAVVAGVLGTIQGRPLESLFQFAFFVLAGVGVRQRSRTAGIVAFGAYLGTALIAPRFTGNGFGILTIIILARLLANVRGVWLASRWGAENELPAVDRLNDTLFDKLSGRMPEVPWPRLKWVFALIAFLELALIMYSLTTPLPPKPH